MSRDLPLSSCSRCRSSAAVSRFVFSFSSRIPSRRSYPFFSLPGWASSSITCRDFALINEGQPVPDELNECCQSTGLVRQVIYAVMGEMLNERHHVGDLYSLEDAQAVIRRLSFETGHYSRTWEISTAHLTEEALRYLERWAGNFDSRPAGLLFEPFVLTDCNGVGCKLIGTPWTDDNLEEIEGCPYSSLRQEQLDAGTPAALVNVLYLAALADVRLLIFDPDAAAVDGLAIFDE